MSESIQTPRTIKQEYWCKHIDNWLASGISQTKYCERENISLASFSWWRTKGLKNKAKSKTLSFVPAIIKEPEPSVCYDLQIIFPNNTKLVLPSNLPTNSLVAIVKSLGGLS